MRYPKLTIPEFSGLAAGGIIADWPFPPLAPYAEQYPDIGSGAFPQAGLAVGRILFARGNLVDMLSIQADTVTAAALSQVTRFTLELDQPAAIESWRQLAGVGVALEVTPANRHQHSDDPLFKPRSVVAIEHPLTSITDPEEIPYAAYRLGYVHGLVGGATDVYRAGQRGSFQIEAPGFDTPITIATPQSPELTSPDSASVNIRSLSRGDAVRVDVVHILESPHEGNGTYRSGSRVFVLDTPRHLAA